MEKMGKPEDPNQRNTEGLSRRAFFRAVGSAVAAAALPGEANAKPFPDNDKPKPKLGSSEKLSSKNYEQKLREWIVNLTENDMNVIDAIDVVQKLPVNDSGFKEVVFEKNGIPPVLQIVRRGNEKVVVRISRKGSNLKDGDVVIEGETYIPESESSEYEKLGFKPERVAAGSRILSFSIVHAASQRF